jgi:hypothetical protein
VFDGSSQYSIGRLDVDVVAVGLISETIPYINVYDISGAVTELSANTASTGNTGMKVFETVENLSRVVQIGEEARIIGNGGGTFFEEQALSGGYNDVTSLNKTKYYMVYINGSGELAESVGYLGVSVEADSSGVYLVHEGVAEFFSVETGWVFVGMSFDASTATLDLVVNDQSVTTSLNLSDENTLATHIDFYLENDLYAVDDFYHNPGVYEGVTPLTDHYAAAIPWGEIDATDALVLGAKSGGLIRAQSYISGPDSWHNVGDSGEPAFENGWVNYGSQYNGARFMKDAIGFVHLGGLVKDGTVDAPIFTLPSGYRPGARQIHVTVNDSDEEGHRIDVDTDGTVTPAGSISTGWTSLENITFYAEQ